MQLGTFSISLTVKDLRASLEFYQKLGFEIFHGEIDQKWIILKNGKTTIGLFEGMFDRNILTFNPGWDHLARPLEQFTDVRALQQQLIQKGIQPVTKVKEGTTGPGSLVLIDPDGNPILIDQHL